MPWQNPAQVTNRVSNLADVTKGGNVTKVDNVTAGSIVRRPRWPAGSKQDMPKKRVGIWLIGARGSVAVTSIVGLIALKKKLTDTTGLVSELPYFADLDLPAWDEFVVGGHDIRAVSLVETAESLCSDRAIAPEILNPCRRELARVEKLIRPGTLLNVGDTIHALADGRVRRRQESPRSAVQRIQEDLRNFARRQKLDGMLVVNVASTEPAFDEKSLPRNWAELDKLIDQPRKCRLGASSIYAIAALDLGYPYINFTPSIGSVPKAICELAKERNTCHMGRDGKTGETLIKSVLSPMFANRNLKVMSWVGHNIFGNLDGQVLDDPQNKETKIQSKDNVLGRVLGYDPQTIVSIEYVKSMGDWKTAWDHIHFRGFLGAPMTMQFTWQGTDSILAGPLILDLVRFTHLAQQRGEVGLLKFLSCFFKSPQGVRESDFGRQFQTLLEWSRKSVVKGTK